MNKKRYLQQLGEETIYTAKAHFKACDSRRIWVTRVTWGCVALSILPLADFHPLVGKVSSALSLFGLVALLIWNEGEEKFYRAKHKQTGEAYLALHKEIRECYHLDDSPEEQIKILGQKVRTLDQSEKPELSGNAREKARRAIETGGETDNWFWDDQ